MRTAFGFFLLSRAEQAVSVDLKHVTLVVIFS